MSTLQQKTEIAAEAARAAPPVAVAGVTVAGVPVNTIVLWLTVVYLLLQIAYLLWRWIVQARAGKAPKVDE